MGDPSSADKAAEAPTTGEGTGAPTSGAAPSSDQETAKDHRVAPASGLTGPASEPTSRPTSRATAAFGDAKPQQDSSVEDLADAAFKSAQARLSDPAHDAAVESVRERPMRPRHPTEPGVAPPSAGAPAPPGAVTDTLEMSRTETPSDIPVDTAFPVVVPAPATSPAAPPAAAPPAVAPVAVPPTATAPFTAVTNAASPEPALRPEPANTKPAIVADAVVAEPAPRPEPRPSAPRLAAPPGGALAAYEAVARSARLADVVAVANEVISEGARLRRAEWAFGAKVASLADDLKLPRADADTPFGNALKVLGEGPDDDAERALAAALWAHAVAESPRKRPEDEDRLAGDILWLATQTPFDATGLLDRALGEEAADLWTAIAGRLRRILSGKSGVHGRGELIVGAAALAGSSSSRAHALATELAAETRDPTLTRILGGSAASVRVGAAGDVRLDGEMVPNARGVVATTILAFTGLLFVIHAVRFVARVALAYKRPTEIALTASGVRVKTRTEMLGKTLREREHVILRTGLVRVSREVRYPRTGFYAGLLALAIGSYVGVRATVDGVRAASPSLLVVGVVIVVVGIAADFVLGTLLPGTRGRCRLAFVPRAGATLTVGNVDASRADAVLTSTLKA